MQNEHEMIAEKGKYYDEFVELLTKTEILLKNPEFSPDKTEITAWQISSGHKNRISVC